jgi:uncharacterized Zn finger protein
MARRRGFGSYYDDFHFPPPSVPREVKGGIKARSKRGAFGESWWARRWVQVLESFHLGARLTRGRTYARKGQVTDIQIEEGRVTAQVQGSRPRPYSVSIEVKTLTAAQWKKVAGRLGKEALYAAKLLAGEIPQDIEVVFAEAGITLFPARSRDLTTECSCPDWSNPCKHIAAVYYLLGEEFDRDPFLIFWLRGMTREGLVELMGVSPALAESGVPEGAGGRKKKQTSGAGGRKRTPSGGEPVAEPPPPGPYPPPPGPSPPPPGPLPPDPGAFWGSPSLPDAAGAEAWAAPARESGAALARRLGGFPFWRGQEGFLEAMDLIYARATRAGVEVLAASPEGEGR